MADERVERRLAAILAADVVGYSRLVGIDEEGTLAALKALRKSLIDPKVTEHRGRIVKNTGDGALVEFASAVDAVRCAVETQREMADRAIDITQERRIEFRIGINIGDIVIEEGDIFGDGVNIAVRLESIAAPGGVCISEDVYRQVRGKLDATFEDIGEQKLKNIVQPVRVYRVRIGGTAGTSTGEHSANLPLPDKPSIAVLAFQNMSGDAEQEYFADGIAEDIITALSKSHWLRYRAQFELHLQGPECRRKADRPGTGCTVCARRQRSKIGQSRSHYWPASRSGYWRSSLGRAIRPRSH
jgi:adenylate cyclase